MRILHRMRFRLFAIFMLVILVAIGTAALFEEQSSEQGVEQYEGQTEQLHMTKMELMLTSYYSEGWAGVQALVKEMSTLYSQRVVVTDADGIVVGDSDGNLLGKNFSSDWPSQKLLSPQGGTIVGTLYVRPDLSADIALANGLGGSINRSLLWGGALAVVVAVVLTFVFSRWISAPVESLAVAARRVGQGDFSHRVQIRDKGEMGELAQTFNSMAGKLERADRLRRNLIADIAHELRSPLYNVRGYVEAIQDGVAELDMKIIGSINEEIILLCRLVDDLRELAQADAGELKLLYEPENVAEIVDHTLVTMQPKTEAKEVSLSVYIPDELPWSGLTFSGLSRCCVTYWKMPLPILQKVAG